jgi:hypothetical protein
VVAHSTSRNPHKKLWCDSSTKQGGAQVTPTRVKPPRRSTQCMRTSSKTTPTSLRGGVLCSHMPPRPWWPHWLYLPESGSSRVATWLSTMAAPLAPLCQGAGLQYSDVASRPWWLPWLHLPERWALMSPHGSRPTCVVSVGTTFNAQHPTLCLMTILSLCAPTR